MGRLHVGLWLTAQLRSQCIHESEAASRKFNPQPPSHPQSSSFPRRGPSKNKSLYRVQILDPRIHEYDKMVVFSPQSFWVCCCSAIVTEISLHQAHEPNPLRKHPQVTEWLWSHVLTFRLKLIPSLALSTSLGEEHCP